MMKEWKRPQMSVVIRVSREENVLTVCKWDNNSGPIYDNTYCMISVPTGCTTCNSTMPS
jgi:hypothetical protein